MSFRIAYLALAVAGGVIPYAFFLQHFNSTGYDLRSFLGAAFANPAASGLTVDLVIASLVFWLVMFRERVTRRGPLPLPYIILNLLVGLSCALPAWLYASSMRHAKN